MRWLFSKFKIFAIILLCLSAVIIYFIYDAQTPAKRLPIYQPDMVSKELVDSTLQYVKKYHKISDFALTNQNGNLVTKKDYKDHIYVADFFFTTCQTICPIMTDHMVEIQNKLGNDTVIKLLSHTVFPNTDTPEVLKQYAIKKGVDDRRWNLVTGSQEEIFTLARKSYLAVKDIPGTEDDLDMVHTENFMLIDKEGRIRNYYDGTDREAIDQLLEDIEILKQEYEPRKAWYQKIF